MLIAAHGRLEAAKSLRMSSIPAIVISGLSDAKKRALLLADNRIAQNAGWDRELLAIELAALPELLVEDDLDISVTGFEPAEIDALHADFEDASADPADEIDDSCARYLSADSRADAGRARARARGLASQAHDAAAPLDRRRFAILAALSRNSYRHAGGGRYPGCASYRAGLASVLQEGRKNANIHVSSGVIWGMSDPPLTLPTLMLRFQPSWCQRPETGRRI